MNQYQPEGTLLTTPQNQEYLHTRQGLERAMERGAIVEAPAILCDSAFDLHVALGGRLRGIIPREEAQYLPDDEIKDIAILTRVGKPVCFKVLGFEKRDSGEVCLLSRRLAQKECAENFLAALVPGDIVPAKVTHLENFGAFVDIGCGMISLLSIDCLSVSRISHPSARLSVGDRIHTVIRSVDERGRIYVSERELLGTWEENAARFSEGQTVRGIIRSVESYGIFVELLPNLAGLAEFKEDAVAGQSCAVYIKSILPEKMKVKLILIDTVSEPAGKQPPEYFIDPEKTTHIDRWDYSPAVCAKKIFTEFT